ncbi:hypothetical protein G6F68_007371 [Rhizopus microsporus]|nr:hypothetical protein G6F67_007734 [Rhizopus microsporus]KAG1260537.1 hypothetical protein G6F68_007371 [Rhizopus microsporus]
MAKTKAASIQGAKSSSIKRASLDALPGSFVLSPILVKKLKIPSFIANLQARSWKNDKSLVESYFKHKTRIYDKPEQVWRF